ncbi:hypothetical protein MMC26_003104 [Xylographa opegraphella]|nr:hypothetical protein [Xylographa opegraphella]
MTGLTGPQRGGAANVHHVSSPAPASAASGLANTPVEQQNHHVGRGGEGNVQHNGEQYEGPLDTLKQIFTSKKK